MESQINDFSYQINWSNKCKLDYEVLKHYVDLDWCIIYSSVEIGILNEEAIRRYAIDLLSEDLDLNSLDNTINNVDLLNLAILEEGYSSAVEIYLKDICQQNDNYSVKKIQYALLRYLFESKMSNSKKLLLGNEVYVEFGYDPQLRMIFSYTTPPYPSLKTSDEKEVESILLNCWRKYLDDNEMVFKKKHSK